MVDIEKIDGQRLQEVLDHLATERTLIKVCLPDRDYTHLTLILGTEKVNGEPYFAMDLTDELIEIFSKENVRSMVFEFTGPDKVNYRFATPETIYKLGRVLVRFPDFIERIQKRSNFRIKTEKGTTAQFKIGAKRYTLTVVNISLGGLYGITYRQKPEKLAAGDYLSPVEITFPFDDECSLITIEKAVVRRVETGKKGGRKAYALEFIEIDRDSRQILTRRIYDLQRRLLKRRIKF